MADRTDVLHKLVHTYCPPSEGETFSNKSTPSEVDKDKPPWGLDQVTGHPITTHCSVTFPPTATVVLRGATMIEGVPRPLPPCIAAKGNLSVGHMRGGYVGGGGGDTDHTPDTVFNYNKYLAGTTW